MDIKQNKRSSRPDATFTPQEGNSVHTTPLTPIAPQKTKRIGRKKALVLFSATLLALIVAVIIWLSLQNSEKEVAGSKPDYAVILPQGKSAATLGGWTRVSPPENDPVYAYSDTIDTVPISVSQQELPSQFKQSTDSHVANLAKAYNATKKLKSGDTTFYLGTSSKGPQSVIFTKNSLLIMIKSEKTVADTSWSAYIKSLTSSSLKNIPKF